MAEAALSSKDFSGASDVGGGHLLQLAVELADDVGQARDIDRSVAVLTTGDEGGVLGELWR